MQEVSPNITTNPVFSLTPPFLPSRLYFFFFGANNNLRGAFMFRKVKFAFAKMTYGDSLYLPTDRRRMIFRGKVGSTRTQDGHSQHYFSPVFIFWSIHLQLSSRHKNVVVAAAIWFKREFLFIFPKLFWKS